MCFDQDSETTGDSTNFYCYQYAEGECGQYDDDDFIANDICCFCGGGETITETFENWTWA